jgi:hypothetical protein
MLVALKSACAWLWARKWYILTAGIGALVMWALGRNQAVLPDRAEVDEAEAAATAAEAAAHRYAEEVDRDREARAAADNAVRRDARSRVGGRAELGERLSGGVQREPD